MKKKLCILLFIIVLLTGCSANYDLLINDKKEVYESITFTDTNESILSYSESVELYLTQQIESYKGIKEFSAYDFVKKEGSSSSGVIMSKKYRTLKDYSTSYILRFLFEDVNIIQNTEYTSFETVGGYNYSNLYGEEQLDPDFFLEKINIKIKFYNNIIDSNADKVDEKGNILEWNITSEDLLKSIYFKIGNEKRYDIIFLDTFNRNIKNIMFVAIFFVIVIFTIIFMKNKFQKNNNI